MTVTLGILALLETQPGKGSELAEFLKEARELAIAEEGTVSWYAFSEPACEALCRKHGTTTEGAFRVVVAGLHLEPVIGLLSDKDRKAITTWRGSLG
jgi:hypothetical protein